MMMDNINRYAKLIDGRKNDEYITQAQPKHHFLSAS